MKKRYRQANRQERRRLLDEIHAVTDLQRERLTTRRKGINPRKLRRQICDLLDELFSLPNAVEGLTENVHQTLHYPWEVKVPNEGSDQPSALAQSCPPTYNDH